MPDDHRLASVAELRAIYPEPKGRAVDKQMDALDYNCRDFIAHSPFLVLGTEGDVSPKGDEAGFVKVLDDTTILIPDRKGNNRLDSMRNIVRNPSVGILFLIPGVNETLRVNGDAEIVTDPVLLESLSYKGKAPASAIRVRIDEVFLHCAKSLIRADLWNPDARLPEGTLKSAGRMMSEQTGAADAAAGAADYEAKVRNDMEEEGRR